MTGMMDNCDHIQGYDVGRSKNISWKWQVLSHGSCSCQMLACGWVSPGMLDPQGIEQPGLGLRKGTLPSDMMERALSGVGLQLGGSPRWAPGTDTLGNTFFQEGLYQRIDVLCGFLLEGSSLSRGLIQSSSLWGPRLYRVRSWRANLLHRPTQLLRKHLLTDLHLIGACAQSATALFFRFRF